MTGAHLLLLEAAGPEAGHLLTTAVGCGYHVHAVTQAAEYATYPADVRRQLAGYLLTDFTRPDQALVDVVGYARRVGAAAVLSTNEYLTVLLAQVCATLGLPGNDPAQANAARDKAAMSTAFARHHVTAPITHVVADEADLRQLIAAGQVTLPCVLKPADGAGSTGVTVVGDPADLPAAWAAARAPRRMYGLPADPRVVVQQYVTGTEYSVESFTANSVTTHLCITAKTITTGAHRVELGHSLPTALPPRIMEAMYKQVQAAITAVGIRNGASHTEVIVDDTGRCTVIEIGARLGAGHIGVLIQHALGIDPWTALLATALGHCPDLTPTRRRYAAVRFLTSPRSGRLRAVSGLPRPSHAIPEVRLRVAVGDTVHPAQANGGRIGHVVIAGADPFAVESRARQVLTQIDIHLDDHADASSVHPTVMVPAVAKPTSADPPLTPAAEFDALYRGNRSGAGFTTVLSAVDPALPPHIDAYSFLSADLLHHLHGQLALRPGDVLADLGCGRGGPGLWLAEAAGADLIGVDFSPVAVEQARRRAAAVHPSARFVVADLTATGLADGTVHAAVSIDALQYASRPQAAAEARRILRPGGRLVLTGWHPNTPGDPRLPERHRHSDWPSVLYTAGFTTITCQMRPAWTETYLRIYRTALRIGDAGGDTALVGLQAEASRRLPTAHLLHRVAVAATAP